MWIWQNSLGCHKELWHVTGKRDAAQPEQGQSLVEDLVRLLVVVGNEGKKGLWESVCCFLLEIRGG